MLFYLQTNFFHDLTAHGFLQRFTKFGIAGYQGVAGVFSAGVFGEEKLVSVGDGYDNGWRDLWINGVAAGRADYRPLFPALHGFRAAAAAETVIAVKTVEFRPIGGGKGHPERL